MHSDYESWQGQGAQGAQNDGRKVKDIFAETKQGLLSRAKFCAICKIVLIKGEQT